MIRQVLLLFSLQAISAFAQGPEQAALRVLESRCMSCHGVAKMAGLDLRTREAALAGGTRGAALVPGDPQASLLFQAVKGDGDLRMPMGRQSLDAAEIEALRAWIASGANYPAAQPSQDAEPAWWAFRKPVRPAVPTSRSGRAQNPIDAFLSARLEKAGLTPAPPAAKSALVRRLYFDLHGLPPSPEQLDRFLKDARPDAYEHLVDELLASPRYGERWGRYWLDVVRYADTGGFETDIYFPNAWRYRDYVIQSFNDDKPYDRFLKEQIAGDEIWPDDLELRGGYEIPEEKQRHLEARIGTGVYTFGPVYHEAALDGRQLRYEWMVDAVDMTGEAFLGLTVTCARCHDHKFDPITSKDYHRMMALFAGSEIRHVPVVNKMSEFGFYSGYPRLRKVQDLKNAIRKLDQGVRDRVLAGIKSRFPADVVAAYETPRAKRTAEQEKAVEPLEAAVTAANLKENASGETLTLPYTPAEEDQRKSLLYELGEAALAANYQIASATVLGHSDVAYPVHVTARGDWRATGDPVAPGVPAVLAKGFQPPAEPKGIVRNRRRAFAEWLASRDHPLTARVMVNRIWQGHFGRGLVATPNNFGAQGEQPSHPDLLDWLAVEFMENGWSMKKLHRQILLSNAYRMSSKASFEALDKDPDNVLLSHANRRRLDAETMRDATLAVAGEINLKMGGEPVIPRLTEEERAGMWNSSQWPETLEPAEHNRRSVYLYVKRSFPFPMFTTFDAPDTAASCGRREETTVAPQALTMMNSQFMVQRASAMARRLETVAGEEDRPRQIEAAFRLAFARPPDAQEAARALELMSQPGSDPLARLCLALLNTNEFLYVD